MRYTTFIFFLLMYLPFNGISQDLHCGMIPYDEMINQLDPDYQNRRAKMETEIQQWIIKHKDNLKDPKEIIRIPVVVHIIYHEDIENVPDEQVYAQIWAMNLDFRRQNADTVNTPAMFKSVAADCQIEFCLAVRTPEGQSTNGIIRVHTDKTEFPLNNTMKSSLTGGSSPWDPSSYLNLWVCKLGGNYLGFAQYPGGNDSTDGVVIDYQVFGFGANLHPDYNFGRTATHEIGHWLDLYHIWGDDFGSCDGSDYVDDTPNAKDANYYCPNHPRISSCNSEGEMFMNYMDYVYDACFNIYTKGQRDRMLAAINLYRFELLSSKGCTPVIGMDETNPLRSIGISPNPATSFIELNGISAETGHIAADICDAGGRVILSIILSGTNGTPTINLEGLRPGFYLLNLKTSGYSRVFKVIIQ